MEPLEEELGFDGPEMTDDMHQERMQDALKTFWMTQAHEMDELEISTEQVSHSSNMCLEFDPMLDPGGWVGHLPALAISTQPCFT
jgi:hypothetical protein